MIPAIEILISILVLVIPIVGGALTALLFYQRDVMEKEPIAQVVVTLLWGLLLAGIVYALITVPIFFLAHFLQGKMTEDWQIIAFMLGVMVIQATIGETIKGLVLWQCILRSSHEIDGLFDGFLYGAMIGTGAGIVDAIVYGLLGSDWFGKLEITIIRTIRIPGTHALFTGLIGLYYAWKKFKGKKILPGITLALGLHIIWNIATYLIFRFIEEGFYYYLLNFSLLAIYLLIMFTVTTWAVRYDRRYLPESILAKTREKKEQKERTEEQPELSSSATDEATAKSLTEN